MSILLKSQKTPFLKKEEVDKKWYLIDAEGKTLGRIASLAATYLKGKHKPTFTPNQDCGDYLIIVNASKVAVTGKKEQQKKYYRHSGYPGGLYTTRLDELRVKHPDRILKFAIKGMLPKNRLGSKMLTNVRIFPGLEHNMKSQKPSKLDI